MCLGSLSANTDTCPLEDSVITCSMLSVNRIPVQLTCRYLKHLHVDNILMSKVFSCLISLKVVGCMAKDSNIPILLQNRRVTSGRLHLKWGLQVSRSLLECPLDSLMCVTSILLILSMYKLAPLI